MESSPAPAPSPVVLITAAEPEELRRRLAAVAPVHVVPSIAAARTLRLDTPPRAFVLDVDSDPRPRIHVYASLDRLCRRDVPVLALSSDLRSRSLRPLFRAGVADVVGLPLRMEELEVRLERLLGTRPGRQTETVPRRIGPWQLLEPIGRGGTSAVFRARHVQAPGEDLALKLIWPHLVSDPEVIQRFRREITLLQSLEHEGLVRLIASGRHESWFYYVMEHLDGGTLRDHINDHGACSPVAATRLLVEISRPLAYLHSRGLIHRDVKPENIYLTPDRTVLGDFGLAKQFTDRGITLEDEFIGTPLYLSPEYLASRTVDRRADIYALGMCAFEWLCGRPVLTGRDPLQIIARLASEGPPSPATLLPELPGPLRSVLDVCLARDPDQRFIDAEALHDAALRALHEINPPAAAFEESREGPAPTGLLEDSREEDAPVQLET